MKQLILSLLLVVAFASVARAQSSGSVSIPVVVQIPGNTIVPGIKCDDVTDDAPAINAAAATAGKAFTLFNYGEAGPSSFVSLPPGVTCKVNETVVLPAGVGLVANGSILDGSAETGPEVLDVKGASDGSNNSAPLMGINLSGNPSRTTNGVLVERANAAFYDLTAANFKEDVTFGSNTYVTKFYDANLFNATYAVYNPGGLSNEGEEVSFIGGSLHDSSWLLWANGGEFNLTDMSLDSVSQNGGLPAPYQWGDIYADGAVVRLTNDHVEKFYGPVIYMEGGANQNCSPYSHVIIRDTDFISDASGTFNEPLVDINGGTSCGGSGPYAKLENVFLSYYTNGLTGTWVTGSYAANVSLCGVTDGTNGNIANAGTCP